MKWLIFALGGLLGTVARYYFSSGIQHLFGSLFPYGTLLVNLAGTFLAGFIYTLSEEKSLLSPVHRGFWLIGFCAAFTTYSNFILETANLVWTAHPYYALENVVITLLGGIIVFFGGKALAHLF